MDRRLWRDRLEAGRALAGRFQDLRGRGADCTLLGLPRGGVPVAAEMARLLNLPLACWAVPPSRPSALARRWRLTDLIAALAPQHHYIPFAVLSTG